MAVVLGPIFINDDLYFAMPWLWNLLAPPLMVENIDDLEWLALLLTVLWFYIIACIIDWRRKRK